MRSIFKKATSFLHDRRKDRQDSLDEGLARLNDRLGLQGHHASQPAPKTDQHLHCTVAPSAECARTIMYTPNMDGQADPGEVVWFWAPSNDEKNLVERALIVIGRYGTQVIGLLTSPNPEHDSEETWLNIGSGPWDELGRQSWVRTDKVVKLPETAIRRQGAVIPRHRFDRIAKRMKKDYGWA